MVHATLSDEEKRKVYDETGSLVDDDTLEQSEKEWYVISYSTIPF